MVLDVGRLDAGWRTDHGLNRLVQSATEAPPGAVVVLTVAPGQLPPFGALAYLRRHGDHLGSVRVESSCPRTVSEWVAALNREDHC